MRIPKFLLTAIVLFNVSQSLFAQNWTAPVTAIAGSSASPSGFTQMWPDNAIIWKYGNSVVGGALRFGSANNLNASGWTERMRITDNGYVGIGTSTPRGMFDIWGGTLHVTGSDLNGTLIGGAQAGYAWIGNDYLNNGLSISPTGQIGVNTSTQHALFSLGASGGKKLLVYDHGTADGPQSGFGTDMSGTARELSIFHSTSNGTDGDISFGKRQDNAGTYTEAMRITGAGNVGIGIANTKTYKLAVNGSAIFTKVVVKDYNNNWPDYVFTTNYRLRPLSEVEQYINEHHHLPEVASAEEVKNNGLDVSENQAALLKKIEELTLYVIELEKRMKELEAKNK